jgi:pimeloyl-ACP methyl ester carboxylesterase
MYKKAGAYPTQREMMKTPSFDQMPKQLKEAFLAVNPDQNALFASYKRDVARMQSFTDMKEEDIKGIKAPTLIIAGDKDVVTPEHAVEMSRQIPNAQLLIWPGGHGDYIGEITTVKATENHYPVLSAIEDFLKHK